MKKTYYKYLQTEKIKILLIFLTTITITLAMGYYSFLIKNIYDQLFSRNSNEFYHIITMMFIMVCFFLFFTLIKDMLLSRMKYSLNKKIQKDLMKEIVSYKYEYFIRRNTGKIIKRVVEDSGMISDGLIKICSGITGSLIIIGWLVFFFILIRSLLFIYILTILIFIIWAFIWKRSIAKSSHEIGREHSAMYKLFMDIIPGIKTIKLELLDNHIVREIENNMKNIHRAVFKNTFFNNYLWNINLILPWISFIMIILFGMQKIQTGLFTTGLLVVSLMMIWRIIEPLNELSNILISFQEYTSARMRINDYRDGEPEIGGIENFPEDFKDIEFNDVSFAYNENSFRLEDMNFRICKGENIAIMGKTGTGKSTIAHLLLRLYDPLSGKIAINGIQLETFSIESLRNNIVFVPQESILYSVSLRNNIDPKNNLTNDEINLLLEKVRLENLISRLPRGVNTNIIKEGMNLSGGEKQRIGIARALAFSAKVYIFDEITSSLDMGTADHIVNTIYNTGKELTTITISHNPDILPHMDRIFVLSNNRLYVFNNKNRDITVQDLSKHIF
jgi:ABC-type multidrug transport system fused ATPase/permease subunit